ncbi:MAG: AbrB/MazE/SpoVT family DNA-binding domain-containing protein [Patescibacteria group bacterium]|nr:AbrB/MazE/SpoVT family DNA-binding domain-containing protein [Patescibacteria group bacterium]
MQTYTLKIFNTGQVTLPKVWRDRVGTKNLVAEETDEGLLIKPLQIDDIVYYQSKDGFGLYCEKGLPVDKIISKIKNIHGSDRKVLKKNR